MDFAIFSCRKQKKHQKHWYFNVSGVFLTGTAIPRIFNIFSNYNIMPFIKSNKTL